MLGRARKLGGLAGSLGGTTAASDPVARGNLALYERVIGFMEAQHKADLDCFDGPARDAVAAAAGVSRPQVDDTIAKYRWTKALLVKVQERKKAGQAMPTTAHELEALMGDWRAHSRGGAGGGGGGAPAAACPLDGKAPGRNAVCPKTQKKFKNCCGKAGGGGGGGV